MKKTYQQPIIEAIEELENEQNLITASTPLGDELGDGEKFD